MTGFLQGLLMTSAVGALLAAALLLLGPALDRRFAPQWRYWAWLLVAVRLALPIHVSLPAAPAPAPGGFLPPDISLEHPDPQPLVPPPQQAVAPAVSPGRPVNWTAALFSLWALGAVSFALCHGVGYAQLRRRVCRHGRYVEHYGGLPVWECPGLPSPVLMGFVRPTVVLPPDMDPAARGFALLHEGTHHRRRDLFYKLLLVWCNAIHWFNPLAWLFRRAAAADLEIACDAALLAGHGEDYRRAYGGALLDQASAARQTGGALTSAFSGGKGGFRRRVLSLLDMRPRKAGRLALALLCAAALLGGSLVACEGGEEELAVYLTGVESTALHYRPAALYDPLTETVYYRVEDPEPDPLPVVKGLDVQSYPAGTGALLTVQNGAVTALKPLSAVETEGTVVLLEDLPAENGLVRYVHAETGAALTIPEETARRLLVLEVPFEAPALGEGGDTSLDSGGWTLTFADRRLWAESKSTVNVLLSRLCTYHMICTRAPVLGQGVKSGDYNLYSMPNTLTQIRLNHTNLSSAVKAEVVADAAVMQALTPQSVSAQIADGTYKAALYSVGAANHGDFKGAPTTLSVDFPGGWDESMGVWWFRNLGALKGTVTLPVAPDAVYQGFPTRLPNAQGPEEHPGAILRMQEMLSSSWPPRRFLTIVVKDGAVVHLSAAADCAIRRDSLGYVLSYEPQTDVGPRLTYAMGTLLTGGRVQVGGTAVTLLGVGTTLLDETGAAFSGSAEEYFSAAQGQMVELIQLDSAVTLRLRPDLDPDTEVFDALVSKADPAAMTLTYTRDGALRSETVPLSPRTLSVALLNSDGNYAGAWGTEDLKKALGGGPLLCRVRLSHGEVTEVAEQATGTALERFVPDRLSAIYMGPDPNDAATPAIHWYRLELTYHFQGVVSTAVDSRVLTYHLEFEDGSPLWSLMGVNPMDNAQFQEEGRGGVLSFQAGSNTVTEAALAQVAAQTPACTLVVTHSETGAQRRFELALNAQVKRAETIPVGTAWVSPSP